jgi:hypothetical protein
MARAKPQTETRATNGKNGASQSVRNRAIVAMRQRLAFHAEFCGRQSHRMQQSAMSLETQGIAG